MDVVLHFGERLHRIEGRVLVLVAEAPPELHHKVLLFLHREVVRMTLEARAGAPRDGPITRALGAVDDHIWNSLFELLLLLLDSAEVLTDVAAERLHR